MYMCLYQISLVYMYTKFVCSSNISSGRFLLTENVKDSF